MNTLVSVAIIPLGQEGSLAPIIAEVVKVIKDSGLNNKTTAMSTEIEGEWDAVMQVVKDATFVLAERGIRTQVVLRADVKPGAKNMMEQKIKRLNQYL